MYITDVEFEERVQRLMVGPDQIKDALVLIAIELRASRNARFDCTQQICDALYEICGKLGPGYADS